jgi:hypothetical protein
VVTGLESAKLKLIRAAEHIKTIDQSTWRYARRKPHKIITDAKGEETADIRKAPPDEIAILAGETVYQLRSALDHLAFDLVKLNRAGKPLPARWEEDCCFPLRHNLAKGTAPPLPQTDFSKYLPNITAAAFAFIEGVQPYYGFGSAKILGWLARLSNIDKHRHLNVIEAKLRHHEDLTTIHGRISSARSGLKHGAKIERIPPQPYPTVNVKRRFTVYVTFDEPLIGDAKRITVQDLLQVCLQEVETVIVPAFDKLLK